VAPITAAKLPLRGARQRLAIAEGVDHDDGTIRLGGIARVATADGRPRAVRTSSNGLLLKTAASTFRKVDLRGSGSPADSSFPIWNELKQLRIDHSRPGRRRTLKPAAARRVG